MGIAQRQKGVKMDELTFQLSSPITEEEWDMIADVDFDHTESILFHTKHGKEVEFVKRKKGKWILVTDNNGQHCVCDKCGEWKYHQSQKFCGECGADMRGEQNG